ncbi:hypothetical protein SAMN05428988_2317 [Chitinophaga sp. YR573]|nr:hypothetical protein SAMN05428988_2317 [Chitinophaga sp. YR573]
MALYACKKDSTSTSTPLTETPADTIDPIALSAGAKVGYGAINVKGTFPLASSDANAPVLDTLYNGRVYDAISNRYIVIYPRVSAGYLAGYYLKINGADSYFKIDYKTGYGLRKAQQKNLFGLRDNNGDNSDSSIVIKLPDHLKGDTFSISYAAYDTLNRISNTITAIVNVIASADSTDNSKIIGDWQVSRTKYNNDDWQIISLTDSSNYNYYTCSKNMLQTSEDSTDLHLPDNIGSGSFIFSFGTMNLFASAQSYKNIQLNHETSSCSNFVYDIVNSGDYLTKGGYSYNAATKTITVIQDEDGTGSYITTLPLKVKEFTSSKMVVYTTYMSEGASHDEINQITYLELLKK